jgi:hypothetical protein
MKRFWLILLSLGLVMAFSVSAFAVDVKIGAEYYAAGMYLNRTNVNDVTIPAVPASAPGVVPIVTAKSAVPADVSTAFFYQRLRVGTDFIVSPSLKLVTRFDVMERIWGGQRGESAASALNGYDTLSAETKTENQNIAFDLLYVQYDSPIGTFKVGYQIDSAWGTVFMDSSMPRGTVSWSLTKGPWFYYVGYKVWDDKSLSAVTTTTTQTDLDRDKSAFAIKYFGKSAEGGLLGGHVRDARSKTATTNTTNLLYYLQPYAKATFGPVKVQAELDYFWGDNPKDSTDALNPNKKLELMAGWVDATANFDMFYAGGTIAYVSGDDPNTTDKYEGLSPVVNGGIDWNPCLIMFNNDMAYWVGNVSSYNSSNLSGPMANAWFFQGRGGVRPTPQWDVMMSISYAQADKKPANFNGTYGTEIDLTGTYKITNNLSYMLGAGYLFTGDYFKGIDSGSNKVNDDFMLINKLTLSF